MGQAADVAHKKMAAFNAQDAERLMALLGQTLNGRPPAACFEEAIR